MKFLDRFALVIEIFVCWKRTSLLILCNWWRYIPVYRVWYLCVVYQYHTKWMNQMKHKNVHQIGITSQFFFFLLPTNVQAKSNHFHSGFLLSIIILFFSAEIRKKRNGFNHSMSMALSRRDFTQRLKFMGCNGMDKSVRFVITTKWNVVLSLLLYGFVYCDRVFSVVGDVTTVRKCDLLLVRLSVFSRFMSTPNIWNDIVSTMRRIP